MEKLIAVLTAMGIALTADQTKELTEVVGKEFVPVADASADKTKLEELTKQLADRDADIAKLKGENKSEELAKQLSDLEAKYKQDTKVPRSTAAGDNSLFFFLLAKHGN